MKVCNSRTLKPSGNSGKGENRKHEQQSWSQRQIILETGNGKEMENLKFVAKCRHDPDNPGLKPAEEPSPVRGKFFPLTHARLGDF